MKKVFFVFVLLLLMSMANAGPGAVRNTKVITYEVVADSTIDGFTAILFTNVDSNYYWLVKDIEIEFDSGTAFTSAGTDSATIYTRTDDDTTVVATIADHYLLDTIASCATLSLNEAPTNGLEIWIVAPASIYAVGDRSYVLRVYYVKREKEY